MTAAQPPGRRTESLFDNRYRYDYIYPRGRSGETLRAYDTQDSDRPVVIKRPAPQDAPPMRAGQEMNIRTEQQALERLAGHPVLTELRGKGSFRVGGHTHAYIVMDLAQGEIVENLVLAQAEQRQMLAELEILVIIDNLLDLLAYAHEKQVIYNDVDAKHLFWDRAHYRLKVIDWGNAVFLDEPGALHSVNRATDIYQCGELLYFILTGGNRLDTQLDDESGTFFVNFGPEADRIPARLQSVVTLAVHPDLKRRYGSVGELRHVLAEIRTPLEKERDEIVAHVRKRVRATAHQDELDELATTLQTAVDYDPGFPATRELAEQIHFFRRQIQVQADLDAIRIYLESGNWTRALALLNDLLPNADEVNAPLIRFLMAATAALDEMHITPPPAGFLAALDLLFTGDAPAAGQILLITTEPRARAEQAQWLLAEQLTVHVPSVILLRPQLARLHHALTESPNAQAAHEALARVETDLEQTPVPGLTGLRVLYQQTADHIGTLANSLENLPLPTEDHTTLTATAHRAQHAAHEIAHRLDAVSQLAFADPNQAGEALQYATAIDPTSPHFEALHAYFDEIRQTVMALGQFRPRDDGSNLLTWFTDVREFLEPYTTDVTDPQLNAVADALRHAAEGWTTTLNYLALGRRHPTVDLLRRTAETIRPFNENIAAWLGNLANRVPDTTHIETLTPNSALGDFLIEGWATWDHGDGDRAAQIAAQAHTAARTDGERLAAQRLERLGTLITTWQAEDGLRNTEATDRAETEALSVLLSDEEQERQTFAEQMPNTTLYLRAMSRGIVAWMQDSSSAGWRALYLHYALRGVLALRNGDLEEAEFWRNAAGKTFEHARTHPVFQSLDRALTGRRLVEVAERALNGITGPHDLEEVRQTLNAPLAGDVLAGAEQSVKAVNDALRSWSDGEFYAVRQSLETAIGEIERAIERADLSIDSYVAWIRQLHTAAVDLHQTRLNIEQGALATSEEPDPALWDAHEHIVAVTLETVGQDYAHQVRQWRDMYRSVLETYTSEHQMRREKLSAFSRHFASLFITRHPAYPLFRHWEAITEQLPADQDVIEDEPLADEPVEYAATTSDVAFLEHDVDPVAFETDEPAATGGDLPWNLIIALAGVLLVGAIGFAVLRALGDSAGSADPTRAPAATDRIVAPSILADATDTSMPVILPPTALPALTDTLPSPTEMPTNTPEPLPSETATEEPATATPTVEEPPTLTPTLFVTETLIPASPTPMEIAAASDNTNNRPQGSILNALATASDVQPPWSPDVFSPGEEDVWLLATAGQPDDTITLELDSDLLSQLFQPGAANSLINAEAVIELVNYDPAALEDGEVAFGLGAANTGGQSTIGQVQFEGANFVSVGMNQNGRFSAATQFPQQNPQMRLAIRRTNANSLSFFIDDKQLGESVFLFIQGEPITLVLYARGPNVTVAVHEFSIDFSPRSELP